MGINYAVIAKNYLILNCALGSQGMFSMYFYSVDWVASVHFAFVLHMLEACGMVLIPGQKLLPTYCSTHSPKYPVLYLDCVYTIYMILNMYITPTINYTPE